jgi:hypothetical protein
LQDRPRAVEFEAHVAFAVQTIVNEEVNLAELCKQRRKPPAAGALDIRAPLPVRVTDRHPRDQREGYRCSKDGRQRFGPALRE